MALLMNKDALDAFIEAEFPQVSGDFTIEEVTEDAIVMRLSPKSQHIRPGGTVSGPSMFALADVAIYFAILSKIGPKGLAVTTNASIDFMRKPAGDAAVLCRAELLKLGRVLAVGDARLYNEGAEDKVLARASMTYSIPPERSA